MKNIKMSKKIALEEAEKRLSKKHDNKIKMTNYKHMNSRATFECKICGHVWESVASEIINTGRGCKICGHKRRGNSNRLSFDEVKNRLEYFGYKLLSTEYLNNQQDLEILFPCGHIRIMSLVEIGKHFKENFGCKECRKLTFYTQRYSEEFLRELLENNDLKFIKFIDEYKDGNSKMQYICKEGHITERDVKYVVKFTTCKQCQIIHRGIAQSGSGGPGWKGGISKIFVAARNRLDPWINASIKAGNNKCCISGETKNIDVHHLYSFNNIMREVLDKFDLDKKDYLKSCGDNLEEILRGIVDLNNEYGYGILIRKDLHILFHLNYGHGNNTKEQFEEFKQKINFGEIKI